MQSVGESLTATLVSFAFLSNWSLIFCPSSEKTLLHRGQDLSQDCEKHRWGTNLCAKHIHTPTHTTRAAESGTRQLYG